MFWMTIGGRQETLFLLEIGGTHDVGLSEAIHNSSLARTRWPGVLPYVKAWLKDDLVAENVLKYRILSQSPEGRDLLMGYIKDSYRPPPLRQLAVNQLEQTIAGTELLLQAAEDDENYAVLAEAVGAHPRDRLLTRLAKLEQRNGDELWSALIGSLNFSRLIVGPSSPELERRLEATDPFQVNLYALKMISGRSDLHRHAEWKAWYNRTKPGSVSQRDLLKLVVDDPHLLNCMHIIRLIFTDQFGYIDNNCLPLYKKLAHNGPRAVRFRACAALLRDTKTTDEVPLVIDFIEPGAPIPIDYHWPPIEQRDAIDLLRERFAENFFSDSTAWRKWWAEYKE